MKNAIELRVYVILNAFSEKKSFIPYNFFVIFGSWEKL